MARATKRATTLKTTLLHSEPGNEVILAALEAMLQQGECPTRAAAVRMMLYESAKQRLGIQVVRDGAASVTTSAAIALAARSPSNEPLVSSATAIRKQIVVGDRTEPHLMVVRDAPRIGAPSDDRIRRLRAMAFSEEILDPTGHPEL